MQQFDLLRVSANRSQAQFGEHNKGERVHQTLIRFLTVLTTSHRHKIHLKQQCMVVSIGGWRKSLNSSSPLEALNRCHVIEGKMQTINLTTFCNSLLTLTRGPSQHLIYLAETNRRTYLSDPGRKRRKGRRNRSLQVSKMVRARSGVLQSPLNTSRPRSSSA